MEVHLDEGEMVTGAAALVVMHDSILEREEWPGQYGEFLENLKTDLVTEQPEVAAQLVRAIMAADRKDRSIDCGCVAAPIAVALFLADPALGEPLLDLLGEDNDRRVREATREAIEERANREAQEAALRAQRVAALMARATGIIRT